MKTALSFAVVLACLLVPLAPNTLCLQERKPEPKLSAVVAELKSGEPLDVTVTQADLMLKGFSIKVPEGAKSLNIVTRNATADIDLLICVDAKPDTLDDLEGKCAYTASTARFNEVLTINKDSDPALAPGTYYIYAGSLQPEGDDEITFTLAAGIDEKPKFKEPRLQPYEAIKPDAFQRAIHASVRIDNECSTGSATVVTPTGLMLTCYHVIEKHESGECLKKDIYVSFTFDARRDPVQSHLAETVFADKERDLALLRIVSDLDGNKIEKPNFTWVPMGDAARLMLDEDLRVLGYPSIGGSRSIYGITATRGTVSGFVERKGKTDFIKTDALISAGNSGGGAFNARFELVAIPTESIHADETMESLGYLRPLTSLPEAWLKTIYSELPK